MTYKLIDIDGNSFDTDMEAKDDSFNIKTETEERTFFSGAIQLGEKREGSKELNYYRDFHSDVEATFRADINEFLGWLSRSVKIRNETLDTEAEVNLKDASISYSDGSFLHCAKVEVALTMLNPYWQDVDYIENTLTDGVAKNITNSGDVDAFPIFEITSTSSTSKISIKNNTTKKGIEIQDFNFSQAYLTEMIVNCETGQVLLGAVALDRNNKIKKGSGFFPLAKGINSMTLESNGSVTTDIKYKRRYYI